MHIVLLPSPDVLTMLVAVITDEVSDRRKVLAKREWGEIKASGKSPKKKEKEKRGRCFNGAQFQSFVHKKII